VSSLCCRFSPSPAAAGQEREGKKRGEGLEKKGRGKKKEREIKNESVFF